MAASLVLDASALVEALLATPTGRAVTTRLRGCELHAPAHLDAEVLSALGRLQRAGALGPRDVATRLRHLETAPIQRHPLRPLLAGAWRRRATTQLLDGIDIELADQLDGIPLVTTDRGLAANAPTAELISPG